MRAVSIVLALVEAELIVTLMKPLLPLPSPGYDELGIPVSEGTDALPLIEPEYTPDEPPVTPDTLLVAIPTEPLLLPPVPE